MNYIDVLSEKNDLVSPGISACQGCGAEHALRVALKVIGDNSIVGIPPGCMAGAGCVGWNYDNGLKVPVHITLLDNTASLMAGVKNMYNMLGRDVDVVAFAGDGATADCGFQSLSAAAERGEDIIYICYDNEGYMNTGFQRSGTTTKGSYTSTTPTGDKSSGKRNHKKDMPMIMAMHNVKYVATLSPAYMQDFVRKIQKAKDMKGGFRYLHIFSPCPTGWKYEPKKSIEIARTAVKTNFFPLFEVEEGKFTINLNIKNPEPVSALLGSMKKFSHICSEDAQEIQNRVDDKIKLLRTLAENKC